MKIAAWLMFPAFLLCAQEFPQAEISNGLVRARLYLPDPDKGYYRATRFDWAGVIPSLEFKGHTYFGQWFEKYDPKIHDAIIGPVEEFVTDNLPLGYEEAKPGGTFLRIGVGVLRKPAQAPQNKRFFTYDIVDPGNWTVHKSADAVEFEQRVSDANTGYAYVYRKTVRLAKGKPELLLEHSLKNTGRRAIQTDVYDHNFFVIDGQPTGRDVSVEFPFELKAKADLQGFAEVRGPKFVFLRDFVKGDRVQSDLVGFGDSAKDYDIQVENRKTGAGVRITGDRPLSRVLFWAINTVFAPEAYVTMNIAPGKEFTWRMAYDFYTLAPAP
jgi:hypothetical protein